MTFNNSNSILICKCNSELLWVLLTGGMFFACILYNVCHFTDDGDGFAFNTFLQSPDMIATYHYVFSFHSEAERWLQSQCQVVGKICLSSMQRTTGHSLPSGPIWLQLWWCDATFNSAYNMPISGSRTFRTIDVSPPKTFRTHLQDVSPPSPWRLVPV